MDNDVARYFDAQCLRAGRWVSLLATVSAGLVLLGWTLNIDLLTRLYPGLPAMHPLTALACGLLGISLLMYLAPTSSLDELPQARSFHRKTISHWLAVLTLSIAGTQLALLLVSAPDQLDTLLFPMLSSDDIGNPSRMSLPTAVMLALLSLAFVLQKRKNTEHVLWISQGFILVAVLGVLLSLIGHLVGARFFYGYFTSIYTSALCFLLAFGINCALPGHGLIGLLRKPGMARTLMSWMLPLGLLLPVSLGVLELYLRDHGILGRESAIYVQAASMTLLILTGILITSRRIFVMEQAAQQVSTALQHSEENLQQLNSELERRIDERTAALRDSETRFRSAMQYSPIGFALVAPDGRWLETNEAMCELVGYSREELLGLTLKDITHPEDLDASLDQIRQMLAGELDSHQLEKRYLHKNGRTIWALHSTSLLSDTDGTPQHFIAQIQDITARKLIEQAMQSVSTELLALEGEAYYQTSSLRLAEILDADIAFVSRLDPDSPDMLRTLAMVEDSKVVPNIHYAKANTPCAQVIAGNTCVIESGIQQQYPDDHYLKEKGIQGYAAMPLLDLNGQIMGHLGVMKRTPFSDGNVVTQALRTFALAAAGQMMRERTFQRYQALFEFSPDALLMTNQNGIIVKANHQAEELFGWSRDELIGQPVEMLVPEQARPRHVGLRDQYLENPEPRPMGLDHADLRALRKDNTTIPVDISLSPMEAEEGMMMAVSIRDISERKEAEQAIRALNTDLERRVEQRTAQLQAANSQLEQARSDAEEANRAKSAFLATMSHEIRTPMNGVVGMLGILAHSKLDEHQSDAVKTIRDSSFTLLQIIDDILDFSKIEAGRLELERVPVGVTEIVESVCSSLVELGRKKGVDLSLFIDPRLPEQIWADPTRLRQVLYNLIGNAIKFSANQPDKRGQVAVRIEAAEAAASTLIASIADNGIGMNEETQARLFSSFSQGETSTTRRFGGTGLGLAISRRLVNMMQGEISVASTPGKGATFTVTLPVEAVAEHEHKPLQDLTGLECIVIDSPATQAEDLCAYLEHAGAHVQVAADLEAAARQAAALTPPVVVVHHAGNNAFSMDTLHGAFPDAADVRHLIISNGRRHGARLASPDVVTLDGVPLRRHVLLRAAAVAAGRASPEIFYEEDDGDTVIPQVAAPTVAEARDQGRLILVAEDDVINQKVILQQLNLLGYAGDMADNGAEALRLWRKSSGNYALLLTDLHMPEMDGYALTETIRKEEKGLAHIPIVALTANALRGEATRAKAIGMDDYLTKPVPLDLLSETLTKWLPAQEDAAPPAAAENVPAANSQETATPVIDLNVLKGLVGNDENIVADFLGDYLTAAKAQVAELRTAIAADNAQHVAAIAHKLKSSSRSIGALPFGDRCADLESACKAGDKPAMKQAILRFEEAYAAVLEQIEQLLG